MNRRADRTLATALREFMRIYDKFHETYLYYHPCGLDAMADIIERRVVEDWGDDQGRTEVQVSRNTSRDRYEIRIACYQDNGRFANYPPHVSPDPESTERVLEAYEELAPIAREANEREHLADITDLVDEIGYDRARDALKEMRDPEEDDDDSKDKGVLGDFSSDDDAGEAVVNGDE